MPKAHDAAALPSQVTRSEAIVTSIDALVAKQDAAVKALDPELPPRILAERKTAITREFGQQIRKLIHEASAITSEAEAAREWLSRENVMRDAVFAADPTANATIRSSSSTSRSPSILSAIVSICCCASIALASALRASSVRIIVNGQSALFVERDLGR